MFRRRFLKIGYESCGSPCSVTISRGNIAGRPGGAVTLGVGMTFIFSKIPFLAKLGAYIYHFVVLFEALFILTTIDAGTRVGRYLLQEAGGLIYKPLKIPTGGPGLFYQLFDLFLLGIFSLWRKYLDHLASFWHFQSTLRGDCPGSGNDDHY